MSISTIIFGFFTCFNIIYWIENLYTNISIYICYKYTYLKFHSSHFYYTMLYAEHFIQLIDGRAGELWSNLIDTLIIFWTKQIKRRYSVKNIEISVYFHGAAVIWFKQQVFFLLKICSLKSTAAMQLQYILMKNILYLCSEFTDRC